MIKNAAFYEDLEKQVVKDTLQLFNSLTLHTDEIRALWEKCATQQYVSNKEIRNLQVLKHYYNKGTSTHFYVVDCLQEKFLFGFTITDGKVSYRVDVVDKWKGLNCHDHYVFPRTMADVFKEFFGKAV